MTLHSPDMSGTLLKIRSMLEAHNVSVQCGDIKEYAHGSFDMEFVVGGKVILTVSWSHVEQRVFLRQRNGSPRGRFLHVSLQKNEDQYWKRIDSWMNRNIEWSDFPKKDQPIERASHPKEFTHSEKILFHNAIINLANAHWKISKSLESLSKELCAGHCRDITEDSAKEILNRLPSRDTETEEAAVEVFLQRFFLQRFFS